jgi:hypothetical protein
MDHQPAPDGARLTAQLLEGLRPELEPRAAACDDGAAAPVLLEDRPAPPAPRPRPPSSQRPAPVRPLLTVLVVVALVGLLLGHEPWSRSGSGAGLLAVLRRTALAGRHPRDRRAADG